MCFNKEVSNYAHKIAEEDIVCYKIVHRYPSWPKPRWKSFYRRFIYEQGELYEEKLSDDLLKILDGRPTLENFVYHSYSDLCALDVCEIHLSHVARQVVLVKCIIPKGSIYWFNSDKKQYASNAIKIVREEPFYKD